VTKKELTDNLLNLYRCKNYKLALSVKLNDSLGVLKAKTELHYLLSSIVPSVLGYNSKACKEFKQRALEVLEDQRKTKEELKKEFVI
jgi:hypothetical protein